MWPKRFLHRSISHASRWRSRLSQLSIAAANETPRIPRTRNISLDAVQRHPLPYSLPITITHYPLAMSYRAHKSFWAELNFARVTLILRKSYPDSSSGFHVKSIDRLLERLLFNVHKRALPNFGAIFDHHNRVWIQIASSKGCAFCYAMMEFKIFPTKFSLPRQ